MFLQYICIVYISTTLIIITKVCDVPSRVDRKKSTFLDRFLIVIKSYFSKYKKKSAKLGCCKKYLEQAA